MSKYQFKYRLTAKSSLATIAKATRALGLEMHIAEKHVCFNRYRSCDGGIFCDSFIVDDKNVPDWLNKRLEAEGLLKTVA